jgi:outer membrane protein
MRPFFLPALSLLSLTLSASLAAAETRTLSLDQAIQIARVQSPVLKKAAAQSDATGARAITTRGKLLPQVVGLGIYQYTTDNFVQRPGFSSSSRGQLVVDPPIVTVRPQAAAADPLWNFVSSYNVGITASQLIYDFSAIDAYKADKKTAASQGKSELAARLTTEFAVRNAFFAARALRELIAVAEQTLSNQQQHLEQVQGFVQVGTRPEIDLAQARTDVANTRVALLRAQNGYASAKENLKVVMGVGDDVEYEVNDDLLPSLPEEELPLSELMSMAQEARPDVSALELLLEAQRLRTRAAKGRFGPALTANANANKAGIELGKLTTNMYVGATLSWALSEGGAALGALRETEANQRGLEADLLALLQRIRADLEQARLTIATAKATVEASDEALSAARARLGLAEGRYEAGVGNAIELGDAQLALTNAAAQRVQSAYNLAIARAQLLSALGKTQ